MTMQTYKCATQPGLKWIPMPGPKDILLLPGKKLYGQSVAQQKITIKQIDVFGHAQVGFAEHKAMVAGVGQHYKIANDPKKTKVKLVQGDVVIEVCKVQIRLV